MTPAFSASVYAKTPNVTVVDNLGLTVRELAWRRIAADSATELLVTRHQYSAQGNLAESSDPRLGAARQRDSSVKANFTWAHDLTGNVLRTDSVDAGITVALADIEGRPLREVSANSVTRRYGYETAPLPGRLLQVTEQCRGEKEHVIEHVVWADTEERDANLVGTAKKHYDASGLKEIKALSLSNAALYATRRILADGKDADWSGEIENAWAQALAPEIYAVQSLHDATGALLTQTDACGHMQRMTYDITGQMRHSRLTLQGGREQTVVESVAYSAAGQKLREEHGNGVLTEYGYEPKTQRLLSMRTVLSKDGKEDVLQDLRYAYDPVGNVLQVRNDAEKRSFWRNQKVEPENTYAYDSLYQLISTSGRELATRGKQGVTLPDAHVPLPDETVYTTYTRSYTYDKGGNLTRVSHHAPASAKTHALDITVSSRSNRAVMKELTENPDNVDGLFDAAGNQLFLQNGQPLAWNGRNELRQVIQVQRAIDQSSDREWYRYGTGSARILKVREAGNRQQRALYLPGLEQRTTLTGGKVTEDLQVLTVGEAGRAQVRVLHWQSGKPDGVDNDQFRYSYDNLIGSSQLELDATGAIISKEEYYPYGGTAVRAARSAVEATYKTIRYSGKERDATGLYYYGYRYYQPWVARWLKPDPAGTVDGLNMYRMVEGNPGTLCDITGLAKRNRKRKYTPQRPPSLDDNKLPTFRYSGSSISEDENKPSVMDRAYKKFYEFTDKTKEIRNESTISLLEKDFSHSAIAYIDKKDAAKDTYNDNFFNIVYSVEEFSKEFPGAIFISENEDYNAKYSSKTYYVHDVEIYINSIKNIYKKNQLILHSAMENRIRKYLKSNMVDGIPRLPVRGGIAALHAEVIALNYKMTEFTKNQQEVASTSQASNSHNGEIYDEWFKNIFIYTQRIYDKNKEDKIYNFNACYTCTTLLSGTHIITGKTDLDKLHRSQ